MNREAMNRLASVFGTAFLIVVGLQLLGLGLYLGLHDVAYRVHSELFAITEEQFDLACYTLLGAMKTLSLTLLLAPWAALRLVAARLPD